MFGFFKERHGTMHTVSPGRRFLWEIPDALKYVECVLDSENVPAYNDVMFHFHMTVSAKREMGFYLHFKGPPIPKYSYYFAAKEPGPAKISSWLPPVDVSATRVSRHFTAHTVPEGKERCGHWNVMNHEQLVALLDGTCGTLMIAFELDDDALRVDPGSDYRVTWTIPRFRSRHCRPFTSRGFDVNGTTFVLRLDQKEKDGVSGDYVVFIFSRALKTPGHSLVMTNGGGEELGRVEPPKDDSAAMPLVIPRDAVVAKCDATGSIVITAVFFRAANPLEQLFARGGGGGLGGAVKQVNGSAVDPPMTAAVGKEQYVVMRNE